MAEVAGLSRYAVRGWEKSARSAIFVVGLEQFTRENHTKNECSYLPATSVRDLIESKKTIAGLHD